MKNKKTNDYYMGYNQCIEDLRNDFNDEDFIEDWVLWHFMHEKEYVLDDESGEWIG